jgi:hypothetical protein
VDSTTALIAASGLHVGFQSVVTAVVYPTLVTVPAPGWTQAHHAHSRRISVVVAPVYLVVAAACLWVLLSGPYEWPLLVAVAAHAVAALATAAVAAPTHGRLGREGPSALLLRRLVRSDRVRLLAALVALGAALLH